MDRARVWRAIALAQLLLDKYRDGLLLASDIHGILTTTISQTTQT